MLQKSALHNFAFLMLLVLISSCQQLGRVLVSLFDQGYQAEPAAALKASFHGPDLKRKKQAIELIAVADGFSEITDLQFFPGSDSWLAVLEKKGRLWTIDLRSGKKSLLLEIKVLTVSEQGLLGLAWHPDFKTNGRLFLNFVHANVKGQHATAIQEFRHPDPQNPASNPLAAGALILEVEQPYQNHNAGQLAFGPDGFLYIGMGDGGLKDDPGKNGQNPGTLLGSMLRVDINKKDKGKNYAIPADNPYAKNPGGANSGARPEIYAIGLRNPWRYSFAPDGRLVVADVGQNLFEELSFVDKRNNLGWNIFEAAHCFQENPACSTMKAQRPFYEYGRADGSSITGGYVVLDKKAGPLYNKYIFGDFVSGRLWALTLPEKGRAIDPGAVLALGKWPLLLSTFGRNNRGQVFVADYASGRIYRIEAQE